MKKLIKLTACAVALGAMVAYADDRKGEEISVTELPPAVTQSVNEKWSDAQISSAHRTMKEDEVWYKVKVTKDGETHVAYVSPDGTIKETKQKDRD
jgi:Protein of unknown function (DUF2874).